MGRYDIYQVFSVELGGALEVRGDKQGETRIASPELFLDVKPFDVAPSFYPVLSSFPAWVVPCWAGEATGAGAEPLA
ncbi:hypothetical protein [Mesorhizobium sp.]|uniref:hypothetical protein n=1 Tax=Mesorhizobium sp. TaxID=1871066 RepID=UPI00257DC1A7|nr:hypothetical protein [Mesorhizobium sp.]